MAASHLLRKPAVGLGALTPHQLSIARLYARGLEPQEIAMRLGLTYSAVAMQRVRILEKLQLGHQRQLSSITELMTE